MYIVNPNREDLQDIFLIRRTVWLGLLIPVLIGAAIAALCFDAATDGLDRYEKVFFALSAIFLAIPTGHILCRAYNVWAAVQAGKQDGDIVKVNAKEAKIYKVNLLTMTTKQAQVMTALEDKQDLERLELFTGLQKTS